MVDLSRWKSSAICPGGEPHGLADEADVDARLPVLGLKKKNLPGVAHRGPSPLRAFASSREISDS
jgi:hypothetical protein